MPFKATEDDLTKFLKLSSDAVVEIPVFRHNPRRKIGIAFVNVDIGGVEDVLKFNDEEMMGRKLKISMAKNQSKQERWQPKKVSSRSGVSDGVCISVLVVCVCVCMHGCVCGVARKQSRILWKEAKLNLKQGMLKKSVNPKIIHWYISRFYNMY